MRAVAYTRVSTDKCEQELSLEHQSDMLRKYAERRGDELIEIYADKGKSGTKMANRADLRRMLADAERGKFEKIYVKDMTRLFRNTLDFIQTSRHLEDLGIKLHLMDFGDAGQDMDSFTLNIFSMLAEQESKKMSKSMKAGKRVSMERGIVPNFVFGYTRVDKFTLVPHPTQAEYVKKIFDLYTEERWGQTKIAKYLFDCRVETSKKKGGKDGAPNYNWSQVSVKHILKNQIYIGKVINHKQATKSIFTNDREEIPEHEWIITEREEFRLISDEQFQKAQEIMKENANSFGPAGGKSRRSEKHLFSNLIKCGECGFSYRRYTRTYPKKGLTIWWTCSRRSAYGRDRCTSQYVKIYEDWLIPALSQLFSNLMGEKDNFFKLIETKCKQVIKEYIRSTAAFNVDDAKTKLRELDNERSRIKQLAIKGLVSMEEAEADLAAVNVEIDRLHTALHEIDRTEELSSLVKKELEEYFRNFKTCDLLAMNNSDLKKLVKEIRVVSQDEVHVYLNISDRLNGIFFPLRSAGGLSLTGDVSCVNNGTQGSVRAFTASEQGALHTGQSRSGRQQGGAAHPGRHRHPSEV